MTIDMQISHLYVCNFQSHAHVHFDLAVSIFNGKQTERQQHQQQLMKIANYVYLGQLLDLSNGFDIFPLDF